MGKTVNISKKNNDFIGTLNINREVKKICVNEATGDYIALNPADAGLLDRWRLFADWFRKEGDRLQKELAKAADGKDESDDVMALIQKRTEYLTNCKKQLDMVFGEGSAYKIFGDIIPDEMMIAEVMNGMIPFIEQVTQERLNRFTVAQYNPNRRQRRAKR